MQQHLDKLRKDALDCAVIRDKAIDSKKQELFAKLVQHLTVLADEVERAIIEERRKGRPGG